MREECREGVKGKLGKELLCRFPMSQQINKKLTSKSIMSVVSGITYIHIARVSFFCRDLDARVPQSTLRAQTIAVFVSLAMHLCVLAGITPAGYQIKST